MADGFIAEFQNKTGITVDYMEDIEDNEEWFADVKDRLSRKEDIGSDLVVPTSNMVGRLHSLGWLNDFSQANIPNLKNLRPDLLNASVDPGRKFSAPYMSGLVGLASSLVLLRTTGLTLLMLTLCTMALLEEAANLGHEYTGSFDGLPSLPIPPLLGMF